MDPQTVVLSWYAAVQDDDAHGVWAGLDPDFRLSLAQQWLTDNPAALEQPTALGHTRDTLASTLAVEDPDHPLFEPCLRVSVRSIRASAGGFEGRDVGVGKRTRVLSADLEVVVVVPTDSMPHDDDGTALLLPGARTPALPVSVRYRGDRWAVAGIGWVASPSWPPAYESIPPHLLND